MTIRTAGLDLAMTLWRVLRFCAPRAASSEVWNSGQWFATNSGTLTRSRSCRKATGWGSSLLSLLQRFLGSRVSVLSGNCRVCSRSGFWTRESGKKVGEAVSSWWLVRKVGATSSTSQPHPESWKGPGSDPFSASEPRVRSTSRHPTR